MRDLIAGAGKTGSNSWVVSAAHSKSGAPLMANDPHLGVQLPNLWLIVGYKSPSYHAVGLMIPGIPVIAVGRNPTIAWGGTNMRAAVSDLYDATKLVARGTTERTERIAVRWWFDSSVTVRETPLGPVLSDAPVLADKTATPFVIRWEGHEVSDEITALLKVSQARTFEEFRAAFKSFAVSGQNMLYADKAGNIGEVMAVRLPGRGYATPPDLLLDPDDPKAAWDGRRDVTSLPASLNPPSGILVSANNRPAKTPVPVGYFFSPDDRIERLTALLGGGKRFGLDDFKALQRDVYEPSAVAVRDLLIAKLDASGVACPRGRRGARARRRDPRLGRHLVGRLAGRARLRAVPLLCRAGALRAPRRPGARQALCRLCALDRDLQGRDRARRALGACGRSRDGARPGRRAVSRRSRIGARCTGSVSPIRLPTSRSSATSTGSATCRPRAAATR